MLKPRVFSSLCELVGASLCKSLVFSRLFEPLWKHFEALDLHRPVRLDWERECMIYKYYSTVYMYRERKMIQSEGILERINESPWARCLQGLLMHAGLLLLLLFVVVVVVVVTP